MARPLAHAVVQNPEVAEEGDEETNVQRPNAVEILPAPAQETRQERADLIRRFHSRILPRQGESRVPQRPGLHIDVIEVDPERTAHAEHTQILQPLPLAAPQTIENGRGGTATEDAAVTPHRPLDPAERQGDQNKRDKVRNHKRAAAVLRRDAGETQKITDSDSAARRRQDHADLALPRISRLFRFRNPPPACNDFHCNGFPAQTQESIYVPS